MDDEKIMIEKKVIEKENREQFPPSEKNCTIIFLNCDDVVYVFFIYKFVDFVVI